MCPYSICILISNNNWVLQLPIIDRLSLQVKQYKSRLIFRCIHDYTNVCNCGSLSYDSVVDSVCNQPLYLGMLPLYPPPQQLPSPLTLLPFPLTPSLPPHPPFPLNPPSPITPSSKQNPGRNTAHYGNKLSQHTQLNV